MGKMKLDSGSRSRIAILGDATNCPSPATGMGTTSGLVGAHVLVGEISKYCNYSLSSNDIENPVSIALKAHNAQFRLFMFHMSALGPGMPNRAILETKWVCQTMWNWILNDQGESGDADARKTC
ncbi:Aromatic-ring hydroxylase-like [Ilyonectria robusta]